MKIVIVNTGVGNVRSVANMLKRVKSVDAVQALISDISDDILSADALILPGVGSFDAAMTRFEEKKLIEPLNKAVLEKGTPILGLCLGMQVIAESSDEGEKRGLGWIPGHLKRLQPSFQGNRKIRVPHMGWNILHETENCVLYDNIDGEIRYYFDHTFYFKPEDKAYYCGKVTHGETFAAGVRRGNIFGCQYHPEKSHRFGLALFNNFVRYAALCERKSMVE